jgi:hypothetical protein
MPEGTDGEGLQRASRALDAANFFLADVRQGLGPYLAIYLLTEQKWDEARIGIVMSIATAAGIVAQTPASALVGATRMKRLAMAGAALIVTLASLLLPVAAELLARRDLARHCQRARHTGTRDRPHRVPRAWRGRSARLCDLLARIAGNACKHRSGGPLLDADRLAVFHYRYEIIRLVPETTRRC